MTVTTLLLLVLALLAGCAEHGEHLPLAEWTLQVPGSPPRQVELPTHLDDELPQQRVTYRLVRTLSLPPELVGRDIELVLTYLPAPVTLYVNERRVPPLVRTGITNEYGGYLPHRWLLPAAETTFGAPLIVELEIEHSWTHSAWLDSVPELVRADVPVPRAVRNQVLNQQGGWFGLIALSQVGLTFLLVYFWDRRRRAYLWFAIQALTAAYYPAYVLGLTSLGLSWPLQNVLLAQSLALAPIISVDFTHDFFGLRPPHRFWRVLLVVALVAPLTVALRDFEYHDLSYAAPIIVACVLSAVLYQLYVGVRLLRSPADRGTVIFFLCCWLALGGSCWVDLLAWLGLDLLEGGRPACVGLGLFGIFQSLLLGRSHFRSLAEADRLNAHLLDQVHALEERQAEIASLNEELRRQIGKRSAEILTALTTNSRRGSVTIEPGYVVEAQYRIVDTLGTGGMGTVFRAVRLSDDKPFALKVSQDVRGLALARLAQEAQIASRVHHTNVVAIVDADVAEDGYVYVVMELVEGRTLADFTVDQPLAWCLDVLRQTLEGVRALHQQGIVHRDLKPSNILIAGGEDEPPRVKITDFGISRWLPDETEPEAQGTSQIRAARGDRGDRGDRTTEQRPPRARSFPRAATAVAKPKGSRLPGSTHDSSSSPRLTQTGAITGTPLYIAPELADRRVALSPAVDVFSFGVVAHLVLSGKLPHAEAPLMSRLAGRDIAAPPPIASRRAGLDPELARALDACLSPDPRDRPEVEVLIALLRQALEAGPAEHSQQA